MTTHTPPAPSAEKTDFKRRQILEAARRLLIEQGFQDVVLDGVARKADVAKGTLYLYFKSKEELLAAVFEDIMEELDESLAPLLSSSLRGPALVAESARLILAHFDRHRDFLAHFTSGKFPACGTRASGRLVEKYSANFRRVEDILRKAADNGAPAAKDPQFAAIALMGLCRAALIQHQFAGSRTALEQEAEKVARFYSHGAAR